MSATVPALPAPGFRQEERGRELLTKVRREDIPSYTGKEKSPVRAFAAETIDELLATAKPGDVMEVTGAPVEGDPERCCQKVLNALWAEMYQKDVRDEVKRFKRGPRAFLERR